MDEFANPTTKKEIQEVLDFWSSKIVELKLIGSQILKRDLEYQKGGDEHMPFFFMMRNTIELLDSVSILIRNSSIQPSKLILRGLLENYFNLEYLTKGDWKRKSYQFLGSVYYSKLKLYKKLDENEQSHSQFKEPFETDKRLGGYPFSNPEKLDQAIANLESLFEKPEYKEIIDEIKRLGKEEKIKNPSWFRLFNGPKSIFDLANKLQLGGLYSTYYRFWSGPVHGTDIIDNNFAGSPNGNLEILQIRLPFEAQSITHLTISLSLYIYQIYVVNRIPNAKNLYLEWYGKNRSFYGQLSKDNIILNTDKVKSGSS
jgi:hypothetical protein